MHDAHMRKRKRLRAELERSQIKTRLVCVVRHGCDRVDGYVVAVGARWVLIAVLDPAIRLDGFAALRIADIRKVRRRSTGRFVRKALRIRAEWPPTVPVSLARATGALDDVRSVLTACGNASPLVTVHIEHDDPDVCFIGALDKVGKRNLRLRDISPLAKWSRTATRFSLDRITRIEIGGAYEKMLLAVGGSGR
jgi:hypothetical protein